MKLSCVAVVQRGEGEVKFEREVRGEREARSLGYGAERLQRLLLIFYFYCPVNCEMSLCQTCYSESCHFN